MSLPLGALNIDALPSDSKGRLFGQHQIDHLLRHIDKGGAMFHADLADAAAGDIGMVGEAADDMADLEPVVLAAAQG